MSFSHWRYGATDEAKALVAISRLFHDLAKWGRLAVVCIPPATYHHGGRISLKQPHQHRYDFIEVTW